MKGFNNEKSENLGKIVGLIYKDKQAEYKDGKWIIK